MEKSIRLSVAGAATLLYAWWNGAGRESTARQNFFAPHFLMPAHDDAGLFQWGGVVGVDVQYVLSSARPWGSCRQEVGYRRGFSTKWVCASRLLRRFGTEAGGVTPNAFFLNLQMGATGRIREESQNLLERVICEIFPTPRRPPHYIM